MEAGATSERGYGADRHFLEALRACLLRCRRVWRPDDLDFREALEMLGIPL